MKNTQLQQEDHIIVLTPTSTFDLNLVGIIWIIIVHNVSVRRHNFLWKKKIINILREKHWDLNIKMFSTFYNLTYIPYI